MNLQNSFFYANYWNSAIICEPAIVLAIDFVLSSFAYILLKIKLSSASLPLSSPSASFSVSV